MRKYKVIILGAGPAGTSTAIQLLKSGHQVTIIERSKFPRDVPGETLHPGIEPLLEQLGVMDTVLTSNFVRHEGIQTIRNGNSTVDFYNSNEKWQGFQLYRKEFDTILLNEVIALGGKVHTDMNVLSLNHSTAGIKSIETKSGCFEADYFIDATGKRAWLANRIGLTIKKYSPKRIAYYGYVKNASIKLLQPKLIWNKNGWTWMSKVNENLIAWVRLDLKKLVDVDKAWCPQFLRDGQSTGPRKAVDVTWRKAQTCCKQNCFLVGDASFVLDPGSSHGVLKAIMSGIMVSYLIDKSNKFSKIKIKNHYNKWINDQFYNDISNLKKSYKQFSLSC